MIDQRQPVRTDQELSVHTGSTSDGTEWDIVLFECAESEIWYQLPIGEDPATQTLFGPFGVESEAIKAAQEHLQDL